MSEADGKHAGTAAGIQQLAGPVETRLLRQDGFELGCIRWTTVPIVGSRAEVDGRVVRHRTSIPASHPRTFRELEPRTKFGEHVLGELLRTPLVRSSENSPSTHSAE